MGLHEATDEMLFCARVVQFYEFFKFLFCNVCREALSSSHLEANTIYNGWRL